MEFGQAIVRKPGRSVVGGLSSAGLGLPDHSLLIQQHRHYCEALQTCGLGITVLPPLEAFPDSCFVEDTAVVNSNLAILTRPGALSRRGEVGAVASTIRDIFPAVEAILSPGTLEGGDVLQVGSRYFVGLSERTNRVGAARFQVLEAKFGYEVIIVPLREMLHLKTGVNALDAHTLLVSGEFAKSDIFSEYDCIEVDPAEAYAANCLNLNGTVLLPAGFPRIGQQIRDLGYPVIEVEMSEFRKLDGGLSCLSIRF